MALPIDIDPQADLAAYRQIAHDVARQIAMREMSPGDRLPTVRELAGKLGVTRVTVHNAYQLLEEMGLVEATVGRGTFVRHDARRALPTQRSTARGLEVEEGFAHALAEGSLTLAEPDPDLSPADEFLRLHRALPDAPELLVGYGAPTGESALGEQIAAMASNRGISCTATDLVIAAGSTPILQSLVHLLARRGDRVLVEESSYFGFLSMLHAAGIEPVAVAMDAEGIEPDALEHAVLRERPRFLYTVPTFHNPTGISMSAERRAEVLAIADRYDLIVVEDDVYRPLAYDGDVPPPLAALAGDASVVYVDSFSKWLLPGLRLGYTIAPRDLLVDLATQLQIANLNAPRFLQPTLAEFIRQGALTRHLERVLPVYRKRRDDLLAALERHMPAGVTWTRPAGGFCCWVSLPSGGDYGDLVNAAERQGVGVLPGYLFDPRRRALGKLRLCFGAASSDHIERAVDRLGALLRDRVPEEAGTRPRHVARAPLV